MQDRLGADPGGAELVLDQVRGAELVDDGAVPVAKPSSNMRCRTTNAVDRLPGRVCVVLVMMISILLGSHPNIFRMNIMTIR